MLSIGLMSGTSMDGIDAALIETDGVTHIREIGFTSLAYDRPFKTLLKALEFAVKTHAGNLPLAKKNFNETLVFFLEHELNLIDVTLQNEVLVLKHYLQLSPSSSITLKHIIDHSIQLNARLVNQLLMLTSSNPSDIGVIGFHGQTVFHSPNTHQTVQVGDGQTLATLTGIRVVNDFRSNDMAHGGQGAPLAPLFHFALAKRDNKIPLVVVNCGGIANITEIPNDHENALFGFDTGPGNGLIDRYIKAKTQGREAMDANGQYGLKGQVHSDVIDALYAKSLLINNQNYFLQKPPKSLDIGDMTLITALDNLSIADACATLEAFTADTIVHSLMYLQNPKPQHWILAGGGWHNPVILRELTHKLEKQIGKDVLIQTADQAGWNSAALEAQTFAYLAVRCLKRLPISFPGTTAVSHPLSGGQVHLPHL